jgi:hypothetical protein
LQTTYNVVLIEEVTAVLTTVIGEAVAVIEAHDENLCRNFEHGQKIDVEAQKCEYGSTSLTKSCKSCQVNERRSKNMGTL